jgi:hypothetical protein
MDNWLENSVNEFIDFIDKSTLNEIKKELDSTNFYYYNNLLVNNKFVGVENLFIESL